MKMKKKLILFGIIFGIVMSGRDTGATYREK